MITRRDVVVSMLSGLTVLAVVGAVRSQVPALGPAAEGPGQATYHVIRWNSPGTLKKADK